MFYKCILCLFVNLLGVSSDELLSSSEAEVSFVEAETGVRHAKSVSAPTRALDYQFSRGYLYWAVHGDSGTLSVVQRPTMSKCSVDQGTWATMPGSGVIRRNGHTATSNSAAVVCPRCMVLAADCKTCKADPTCQGGVISGAIDRNISHTYVTSKPVISMPITTRPVPSPMVMKVEEQKPCTLPTRPNVLYSRHNCPTCRLKAGSSVPHDQLVAVTCAPGYMLVIGINSPYNKTFVICQQGVWESAIPQCYKLCPPLTSLTVDLECWQGPSQVGCDQPAVPGTTAKYNCKEYHEAPFTNEPSLLVCRPSGKWSRDLPGCKPKCGQSGLNSFVVQPAIVGGKESKPGMFPWHTAIFHNRSGKWETVCGGTLISSRAVLTAAHCVTQHCLTCKSPVMDTKDVMVAFGKNRRDWYIKEETDIRSSISKIHIQTNYVGSSLNYGQDIAILILESDVQVNSYVMPACVDYQKHHVHEITKGICGYVAGWGNTQECSGLGSVCDYRSDELQYGRTTIVDFNTCYNATQSIKGFPVSRLSPDKYCTGNGSESVVQQGDSGGGLTFVFGGVHFVYGIVSVKLKLDVEGHTAYNFGSFTSVPAYIDWLSSKLYQ